MKDDSNDKIIEELWEIKDRFSRQCSASFTELAEMFKTEAAKLNLQSKVVNFQPDKQRK